MAADIWAVADLLRGDYKRHEYGQVILPFTVLRRLDAVMAPTREAVRARDAALTMQNKEKLLEKTAGLPFYNVSKQDFTTIASDAASVAKNLRDYVNGFSANVREILAQFEFDNQVTRLAEAKLLYQVVGKFAAMKDLDKLSNHEMGYVFEHLIRKFAEDSNETAGEHFTPREVIELMVNLLIAPDADTITGTARSSTSSTPPAGPAACSPRRPTTSSPSTRTPRSTCSARNSTASRGRCASRRCCCATSAAPSSWATRSAATGSRRRKFDYMLANPPFGVEWKKVKDEVEAEAEIGYAGRFGAGLPRINDGSFLFLQHMISKMNPVEDNGTRLAIVFNGSPLFTGAAGSGESEIRRWILENDWLEGIVALPDQLFYNTGISTYFWILSNRKAPSLQGKVILLDARDQWEKMRKSLGDKRKLISDEQIKHITELYVNAVAVAADAGHPDHGKVKIFGTAGLRLSPDHGGAAAEAAVRDHRRHPRRPGGAKPLARWDGRDAFVDSRARLARHGLVDEEGSSAALHAAARSAGALWPSTASVLEGASGPPSRSPTPKARSSWTRTASRSPTRTCATTRTSPWTRTSTLTSPARSRRTSPTPGSTAARRRSATRSPSPAISTSTLPRAPWPRSMLSSAT